MNDNYLKLWIKGFCDPAHTEETRLKELKELLAQGAAYGWSSEAEQSPTNGLHPAYPVPTVTQEAARLTRERMTVQYKRQAAADRKEADRLLKRAKAGEESAARLAASLPVRPWDEAEVRK